MKPNVGGVDRAFRVAFGLLILGAGAYFHSWWGALGAIPLLTGLLRWCPIYVPFETSTFVPRHGRVRGPSA